MSGVLRTVSAWRAGLFAFIASLALGASTAFAHVGSPDTWFEGKAGAYPIRVFVRSPGVVPGLAQIDVRVLDGRAAQVDVQPYAWNAGDAGAPPPDPALPVSGETNLYSVNLWLMEPTSYGVHVRVRGDRGSGLAVVPVQAVATRRLPMDVGLGAGLIALGLFLFVGMISIVGAALSDGSVPPDRELDRGASRRARLGMALAAAVLAAGLYGGWSWWRGVDRAFAANLFRPFHAEASVIDSAGGAWLRLTIDDERWRGRRWTPLLPDHGKLMHLFLVRDADLGAIAHLHPVPRDSNHFESRLPPLPAGTYRVYADLVHESGFAQTLTARTEIDARYAALPYTPTDTDDAAYAGYASDSSNTATASFTMSDGSIMTWDRGAGPITEGREHPLRFRVTTSDGAPAALEPYLGMNAHAVVTRDDGSVFAHLHPIGTVSMASQMALVMRTPADSVAGSLAARIASAHATHAMPAAEGSSGEFSIPYAFPKAGRYRIWVQVKRGGAVRTAAFDVLVAAAQAS